MQKPSLYEETLQKDIIFQGDIFSEFNFYIPVHSSEVDSAKPAESFYFEKRMMAVISQTCDIPKSHYLLISPIYTIEEYFESEKIDNPQKAKSGMNLIKSRKGLLSRFYLEGIESKHKECFIDLRVVNTINKNLIKPADKIASLSHWGRQVLNHHLMWLFGRPVVDWV